MPLSSPHAQRPSRERLRSNGEGLIQQDGAPIRPWIHPCRQGRIQWLDRSGGPLDGLSLISRRQLRPGPRFRQSPSSEAGCWRACLKTWLYRLVRIVLEPSNPNWRKWIESSSMGVSLSDSRLSSDLRTTSHFSGSAEPCRDCHSIRLRLNRWAWPIVSQACPKRRIQWTRRLEPPHR